ncbi:MAG: branched-chain amino acid ABC transporter permease [Burkholderiaceae bacterium]|nr:branched-chain amino acid ABC transporter permease [Burkholderiaceae bacterium]
MTQQRKLLIIGLFAAAIVWPFVGGQYGMSLMTQIFIFGMLALSADLLLGHAGLFSLCHAAFFSVAAYTTAILQVRYQVPTELAAPAGILMGTGLGLLFGLSVRTRGVYFILVTLAMGYVIWGIGYRWASFTGGDSGVTNVPAPTLAGVTLTSLLHYYYFVLAVLALVVYVYHRLIHSPFGLALRGIKSGENRMRSLGFSPPKHLYTAFIISSAMASLAGVLYAYFNKFVNPVSASLHVSFEAVLMALVGGSATILGPFIGAGVILGLRNWVSSFFELHLAVMGLVFIAVVTWAPDGVIGVFKRLSNRSKKEASNG